MLQDLFTFPIVMIDGDNEERKMRNKPDLGIPMEDENQNYDIVYGEAEYPYFDFIGIEDRWLPTDESFKKALKGRFDACIVRFVNVGQLLVPWSKKRFKEKIEEFAKKYEEENPKEDVSKHIKILTLTPKNAEKLMEEKDGEES